MNGWRGAWNLAKFEWRRDRVGMLITVPFILYMLMLLYQFYKDVNEASTSSMGWLVDILQLAWLPILGFPANRMLMKAWREDAFTNKIVGWRIMPISVRQIVAGRIIQLLGLLLGALLIYFIALYAISEPLREQLDIVSYAGYVLFWIGYAVGIAASYTFWEQGFSGKTYTIGSFFYVFLYMGAAVLMGRSGHSVTVGVMRELQGGNWWYTAGSLVFGALMLLLVYRLTCMRLQVRSYTR